MKRTNLILFLIIFVLNGLLAQKDTITAIRFPGGYRFEVNRTTVTINKMIDMMKDNPEAYKAMRHAKSSNNVGNLLGYTGGFLIGFPFGYAITGGEAPWVMAGVGAILVGFSLPIMKTAKKQALKAVEEYNKEIRKSLGPPPPSVRFGMTYGGAGIILQF